MKYPLTQIWHRGLGMVIAAILAIALAACSPATSTLPSRLVVPTPSGPGTFNYPLNQSAYSIFGYIYDSLLRENPYTGELEPGLAESWNVSPDGQKIVITLRDNLKWSDGEEMTVDDIIFTYNEIYLNDKIPSGTADILAVGEKGQYPTVKKLDNRRVEFSVPEPFAPFLRYAGGLPILPAHALASSVRTLDAQGNPLFLTTWGTETDPNKIIGNGPYRLASYAANQRVILQKNPYYWRQDEQGNSQPFIEQIVWQIMESTDTQLLNFRSGSLDTLDVQAEAYPLLKPDEKRGQYTIYSPGPDTGTVFLTFNQNQGKDAKTNQPFVPTAKSRWFNNKAFRQAIYYAINREVMKNNIYLGLGALQHSAIPVQSPYYLSPEAGLKTYQYNPEKAKKLLEEAGFKSKNGRLLDADGNPVQFTILIASGMKVRSQMATQITQDLGKLGIKVFTQPLEFNAFVARLRRRDWEAYLGGFTGGFEPHGGYVIWSVNGRLHSFNQGPQPGQEDIVGWKPSDWEQKIDALYIQASQELDEEKRQELYAQTQQIAAEELPFLYMVNPLSFEAIRDRIENLEYTPLGGAFWNLYQLKIKE
ncbi:peptide ABC transporter substrate-binding protein [Limnoraphis robusta CS-951]|uniref:Peptide ABC transporter substrate-binding protein n=2 Tax=Limnoraphis TaxID=1332112 RepID=A0A0F5Y8Z0_9CYAN|nr:ABC transporter substrate-binding protein [Limnoraphis robusta]KKD35072.1 peptide ABC transporter substrate-binding protein [Limnoraphis robusta CS-951]